MFSLQTLDDDDDFKVKVSDVLFLFVIIIHFIMFVVSYLLINVQKALFL